ncbi:MAG TPA: hypothetical protein VN832_01330 [Stellaceae bacterium]|nr:hypothetical protein [Stellaceae bacterium]
MSGTQPIGAFTPTNYPGQASGSAYPLAIDANWAVAQRSVDTFAPRTLPTPAMALMIDPGHLFNGQTLIEIGAFTTGNVGQEVNTVSVTGPTAGIAAGQILVAYSYVNGAIAYPFAIGANGASIVESVSGASVTTWNLATNGASSATLVFGQPIGAIASAVGSTANGSNVLSIVTTTAGIFNGMAVSGVGIPAGTIVTNAAYGAAQVQISANATATASGIPFYFTIPVPSNHPRIDRIVINRTTGAAQWLAGSESASPTPPAIPLGFAPCCQISLTTSTAAITATSNIIDERDLAALGLPMLQPLPYQYAQPTSGGSITINNGVELLIIDPAGTLAALTVIMPAAPLDGQRVALQSSQTITTLTQNPNTGQTIKGAATTLAANGPAQSWIYRAANSTWYSGG